MAPKTIARPIPQALGLVNQETKKPIICSTPSIYRKFINLISGKGGFLLRKYYLTDALIKKVYFIHGIKDEYVPFERSIKKIIEKYNLSEDKYLLVDGNHYLDYNVNEILDWIYNKL